MANLKHHSSTFYPLWRFRVKGRDECVQNSFRVIGGKLGFELFARHLWGLLVNQVLWHLVHFTVDKPRRSTLDMPLAKERGSALKNASDG